MCYFSITPVSSLPEQTNMPCSSSHRGDERKAGEDEECSDTMLNVSGVSPRSTAWGWKRLIHPSCLQHCLQTPLQAQAGL